MSRFDELLVQLNLDASAGPTLERFVTLFLRWNAKINLSAARSTSELDEHVRDSLHVIPRLPAAGRVLDVGSGGGLPVVVAAICLPATDFVALEPVHKKHAFLRTAARELQLPNLESRAQRLDDHAERDYDAAISRATFDLVEWLELGLERVRPGGSVIAFEAVPRTDLPAGATRVPYELEGKTRALIQLTRP